MEDEKRQGEVAPCGHAAWHWHTEVARPPGMSGFQSAEQAREATLKTSKPPQDWEVTRRRWTTCRLCSAEWVTFNGEVFVLRHPQPKRS